MSVNLAEKLRFLEYITILEDEVNYLELELVYFIEENKCSEAQVIIKKIKKILEFARVLRRSLFKNISSLRSWAHRLEILGASQEHIDKIQMLLNADSYIQGMAKMKTSQQVFETTFRQYERFVKEQVVSNRYIFRRIRKLNEN